MARSRKSHKRSKSRSHKRSKSRSHKLSHKRSKSRSHKRSHKRSKSRSHKRSRKRSKSRSRSRKSRVYRLTKKQHHRKHVKSCRSRKSEDNCVSDPNCSWNSDKKYCYKGKRSIYEGPALPFAF